MQYYTFDLDEESKDYCVIATPFGLYRYLKMPMGIRPALDISQHAMETTLRDVEEADAYFDVGAKVGLNILLHSNAPSQG